MDMDSDLTKSFFSFLKDVIYFLGRGEGKEKERETSMCGCLLWGPTGDLAHNPGLSPDWESNWWPFGLQARAQSTELQPARAQEFFLWK